MYLFWYKKKIGINNFGDELNPYIIKRLTGQEINYLPIAKPKLIRILTATKRFLNKQITFHDLVSIIKSLRSRKYYVAIGSIIESVNGKNCHVWGAGLINRNGIIKKNNFHAVRGEITRNRLKELGHKLPSVIGDPALLLPLIYAPHSKKKYELGIIPHYVQNDELSQKFNAIGDNIIIIDLLNNPETIIYQINSCKKTISSSLHGIIVSHAYGIPSLWCNLGEASLAGDNVKFEDYFSSVNIEFYQKLQINLKEDLLHQVSLLFSQNKVRSLINKDLYDIQKNLIKAAPFEVLENYRKIVFT